MRAPVAGGGDGLLAFTDRAAAEEFLAASGRAPGVGVAAVPTKAKFAEMLTILASTGYTHVVFDDGGRGAGWKRSFVIEELLREVRTDAV
jgi:hypothetical protein